MAVQELKSSQVDLPDKVAEAVLGHMQPAWQQGGPWAAPGLTITSFHLPQLQRSLEVRLTHQAQLSSS